MKFPWTKLATTTEMRFVGTYNYINKEIQKVLETAMKSINQWKKSEQIKYNRIDKRLQALESTFSKEIQEAQEQNLERERLAAEEIDKNAEV